MGALNAYSQSAGLFARVDDFLEQFLLLDENGDVLGIKATDEELRNLLQGRHPPTLTGFSLPEEGAITNDFECVALQRYSLLQTHGMRREAEKHYQERKRKLSPTEQLRQLVLDSQSNPAEAVVVAKMHLYGWFDTPQAPVYARELLISAADDGGESSAAAILARGRIPSGPVSPFDDLSPRDAPFLIDDRVTRSRYDRIALATSEAYRNLRERELSEDYDSEFTMRCHEAEDELEAAERLADSGQAQDMYSAGLAALKLHDLLAAKLSENIGIRYLQNGKYYDKEFDRIKQHLEKAKNWLYKAQIHIGAARTLIAERFERDGEKAFALLFAAAFPEDGVIEDPYAQGRLARHYYLNRGSAHYNLEAGERCLHLDDDMLPVADFWRTTPQGEVQEWIFLGDTETAIFTADYLRVRANRKSTDLQNVLKLYRCCARECTYAALKAGLLLLRGDGCERDFEQAKDYFVLNGVRL